MSSEELIRLSNQYIMGTYNRSPLVIKKGRGNKVYDPEGKEYLDFISGIAVNSLGHCFPPITVALQKQAQRLIHASNLYYSEPQIFLAKKLVEMTFEGKVFFCNSGTEANEAALKLVRKYFKAEGKTDRYEFITMNGSFHGRTYGGLSASGQEKLHHGYEPLLPGFVYVNYDDLDAVEKAISAKTAAILVEPIQGERGIIVPSSRYLRGLRELADRHGLLLIFDEIQTGLGRTGSLFAYEYSGITPDILTLAKGLGGGVPIGAMIAKNPINKVFSHGSHGSTFGGNPLACSAGLVVVETLTADHFILENCRRLGAFILEKLMKLQSRYSFIKEVRGKGLLIGMELLIEGRPIVLSCLDAGLLINCTAERILRFAPPLNSTEENAEEFIEILESVFEKIEVK
ncbi:MAG: aspartate aminotransferase family protein [Nitrospirae bacterium]|nr:aspartate aminotransferase family protein [Nitrospirota bacterium]MBI3353170.1 aspartate aminotransferase family protein [Nitrospirota bacterium]